VLPLVPEVTVYVFVLSVIAVEMVKMAELSEAKNEVAAPKVTPPVNAPLAPVLLKIVPPFKFTGLEIEYPATSNVAPDVTLIVPLLPKALAFPAFKVSTLTVVPPL
jgi:hypothetical protein